MNIKLKEKQSFITTCFVIIATILLISGCNDGQLDGIDSGNGNGNGKEELTMEKERANLNDSLPTLDQEIPKNLKTATLAKG